MLREETGPAVRETPAREPGICTPCIAGEHKDCNRYGCRCNVCHFQATNEPSTDERNRAEIDRPIPYGPLRAGGGCGEAASMGGSGGCSSFPAVEVVTVADVRKRVQTLYRDWLAGGWYWHLAAGQLAAAFHDLIPDLEAKPCSADTAD